MIKELLNTIKKCLSFLGINPLIFYRNIREIFPYLISFAKFIRSKGKNNSPIIDSNNIKPMLMLQDKNKESHSFEKHYTQLDLHVARLIFDSGVKEHLDIGSSLVFIGHLSSFLNKVYCGDIRLNNFYLPRVSGLLFDLTDDSKEILNGKKFNSISCLHVIEHIGLGRYGDNISYHGDKKAIRNLSRLLSKNGKLYLAVPSGKECIYFNAHRVYDPENLVNYLSNFFKILKIDFIDDKDYLNENLMPKKLYKFKNQSYGLIILTLTTK